jgi:hypothetical protein
VAFENKERRQAEMTAMSASTVRSRIAAIVVIAALCVIAAGCAVDPSASSPGQSANNQLRYYGGPKSPMWANQ